MYLGRFGLFSQVSSVRLGLSSLGEENLPSDQPKLVFGGKDPLPIVIGVGSVDFRVSPSGLGRWVGFQFLVDSPICKFCSPLVSDFTMNL